MFIKTDEFDYIHKGISLVEKVISKVLKEVFNIHIKVASYL